VAALRPDLAVYSTLAELAAPKSHQWQLTGLVAESESELLAGLADSRSDFVILSPSGPPSAGLLTAATIASHGKPWFLMTSDPASADGAKRVALLNPTSDQVVRARVAVAKAWPSALGPDGLRRLGRH
jgi:hypothetical protein